MSEKHWRQPAQKADFGAAMHAAAKAGMRLDLSQLRQLQQACLVPQRPIYWVKVERDRPVALITSSVRMRDHLPLRIEDQPAVNLEHFGKRFRVFEDEEGFADLQELPEVRITVSRDRAPVGETIDLVVLRSPFEVTQLMVNNRLYELPSEEALEVASTLPGLVQIALHDDRVWAHVARFTVEFYTPLEETT